MKRDLEGPASANGDYKRSRQDDDQPTHHKSDAATKEEPTDPAASATADSADEDDQPVVPAYGGGRAATRRGKDCPYLDTVSRQNLDFDFEKCCSVSLSPVNVYACLVCGKYFQGRGPNTHAFTHSLESNHHMFMKLETGKVYCLPDGYEVIDRSLDVIRFVLNPTFAPEEVSKLDVDVKWARALDGTEYMPGLVGVNNMKNNDYVNVAIQLLARVLPIRDYFLVPRNYQGCRSMLVQRFGELVRKIWNPRNFKGQVSPHEFMQAVMTASAKRFTIEKQSDPVEFWSWFVNTLHSDLTGGKRKKPSIISKCFQGELEITTEAGTGKGKAAGSREDVVERVPFLMLGLDLPPAPLYKDAMEKNIIPQVPIFDLLRKFDGAKLHDDIKAGRRRYRLTKLPQYLTLHMKRFTKNNFFVEKNPTIVNFPVKNLELRDIIPVPTGRSGAPLPSKYDLTGNLVHDGKAGEGAYRVHVHRKVEDTWYEVQDLRVVEILPQMVALSETYMQVYELKKQ
ncbi:hypothetical protein WJX72_010978 [[Myrmecia] bisecta]|uniref:U4/U6.U5 tri-snRNP-associated protein 2 n=1 Tax=[Myrmecia] bisecta TaxID=41462 RepID=A0AAW1PPA2_9CHLO